MNNEIRIKLLGTADTLTCLRMQDLLEQKLQNGTINKRPVICKVKCSAFLFTNPDVEGWNTNEAVLAPLGFIFEA